MPLKFTGSFKIIARLPEGPMQLPEYLDFYMGDTAITENIEGQSFKMSINPTWMNRSVDFKLGQEFTEVVEGAGMFKTKMTVDGDNDLVQTAICQQSNKTFQIVRKYNGKPIPLYAHREQVQVEMLMDGKLLPWFFVMVER